MQYWTTLDHSGFLDYAMQRLCITKWCGRM